MRRPHTLQSIAFVVGVASCATSTEPVGRGIDAGAANSDGAVVSDGAPAAADTGVGEVDAATAAVTGKRVFATSKTRSGNLGGLAGADALCNDAAKAAKLGGTFKAWLSTSTLNARDRIAAVGPWVLVDGTPAFNAKSVGSFPLRNLDMDETGAIDKKGLAWTGTKVGGVATTETCDDWTSTGASGTSGYAGEIDQWSDDGSGGSPCNLGGRLYCFEQ